LTISDSFHAGNTSLVQTHFILDKAASTIANITDLILTECLTRWYT